MDPQYGLASKDDLWRLQNEMKNLYATTTEHADRLMRLEHRQDSDNRIKSPWGSQSPFPSTINGTPQHGIISPMFLSEKLLISVKKSKATILLQKPSRISIKSPLICLEVYISIRMMNQEEVLLEPTASVSMRAPCKATLVKHLGRQQTFYPRGLAVHLVVTL